MPTATVGGPGARGRTGELVKRKGQRVGTGKKGPGHSLIFPSLCLFTPDSMGRVRRRVPESQSSPSPSSAPTPFVCHLWVPRTSLSSVTLISLIRRVGAELPSPHPVPAGSPRRHSYFLPEPHTPASLPRAAEPRTGLLHFPKGLGKGTSPQEAPAAPETRLSPDLSSRVCSQ